MKIIEIKEQFLDILKNGIISFIDTDKLVSKHPNYPYISKIKLFPNNIELTSKDIDSLNNEETIKLSCNMHGFYKKTHRNGNLSTPKSHFDLEVKSLKLKIVENRLIIDNCECTPTLNIS
jgi:hypothetical protein